MSTALIPWQLPGAPWVAQLLLALLASPPRPAAAAEIQATASLSPTVEGNTVFLIDSESRLYSFGSDVHGQLGLGTMVESKALLYVGGGYSAVSVGTGHMAALKTDGSLWTWGWGIYGQLGLGGSQSASLPQPVGTGFTAVAAGYPSTYALKGDGTLWAWGQDNYGTGQWINVTQSPTLIGTGFKAVSTGGYHVLALNTQGDLYAWGNNAQGQLGRSSADTCNPGTNSTYPCSFTRLLVRSGIQEAVAAASSSYALDQAGGLWSWGDNDQGQLGDGSKQSRSAPARVLEGVTQVSASGALAVALKQDGSVWVWGLGVATPQRVSGTAAVTRVRSDGARVFALRSDRTLWVRTAFQTAETLVSEGVAQFNVAFDNLALIKLDGGLWVSGKNNYGQLGQGTTVSRAHPARVPGAFRSVGVDSGWGFVVAAQTDGSLWTWGDNQSSPMAIPSEGGFTAVAVHGREAAIGLKADGALHAVTSRGTTRIGSDFAQIGAGGSFFAALKKDGTLWTWSPLNYTVPNASGIANTNTLQQAGSGFARLSAGYAHVMALKPDGSLWGWGDNSAGQLGLGSSEVCAEGVWNTPDNLGRKPCSRQPLLVGNGFVDVSAGYSHTLAIKADGSLWAWGMNLWGAFGDGRRAYGGASTPSAPQRIGAGFVKALAFGYASLAIRSDGSVWSWGRNLFGSLGHGTFNDAVVATPVIDEKAAGYLNLLAGQSSIPAEDQLAYFLSARNLGGTLDFSLTDLRAVGFEGAVYFSALVPAGSLLAPKPDGQPRRRALAASTGATIPVSLSRGGIKQTGAGSAAQPAAEGSGILQVGNQFSAYQGLGGDPLGNSNVVICAGITVPALSAKGQVLVRPLANGTALEGVAQCPPIQTEATLRLYRGQASGALGSRSLVASITPQDEDRGQLRYVYSWAVTPDGRQYMQVADNAWEPMKEPMQAARQVLVPLSGDVVLPVVRDMNLGSLLGTHVFIGMGASWAEVRKFNKAGHYYTVE